MKALRCVILIFLIGLLAVTPAWAASFTSPQAGIDFSVPAAYTCITPDTVKQNQETVELLGHSTDSLKSFMAQNDVLLLAVMPQNAAQLQLRVSQTEFSKDIISLDGLGEAELHKIGEKLAENYTLQTVNGITYFCTVQSGTGYGTVQYITVKNGAVYRLLYYGTSLAEAKAAIEQLQIKDTHGKDLPGKGMTIFLSIAIVAVILLALVAIFLLGFSFYKDLKERYGEKNDVREYIRIKRRKF